MPAKPSISDIFSAFADEFELPHRALQTSRRASMSISQARAAAVFVARRAFGYSVKNIAGYAGFKSANGVYSAILRIVDFVAVDPDFRDRITAVADELECGASLRLVAAPPVKKGAPVHSRRWFDENDLRFRNGLIRAAHQYKAVRENRA